MENLWFAVVIVILVYRALNTYNKRAGRSRGSSGPGAGKSAKTAYDYTVTIQNIGEYRSHTGMIRLVQRYSGWTLQQAKDFLRQNNILNIHNQLRTESVRVIEQLNQAGIEVANYQKLPKQDVIFLKAPSAATNRIQKTVPVPKPARKAELKTELISLLKKGTATMSSRKDEVRSGIPAEKLAGMTTEEPDPFAIHEEEESEAFGPGILIDDPRALVQAVIMKEILDGPVSERQDTSF